MAVHTSPCLRIKGLGRCSSKLKDNPEAPEKVICHKKYTFYLNNQELHNNTRIVDSQNNSTGAQFLCTLGQWKYSVVLSISPKSMCQKKVYFLRTVNTCRLIQAAMICILFHFSKQNTSRTAPLQLKTVIVL